MSLYVSSRRIYHENDLRYVIYVESLYVSRVVENYKKSQYGFSCLTRESKASREQKIAAGWAGLANLSCK